MSFDLYTCELYGALQQVDGESFDAMVALLLETHAQDRSFFFCGNGGSASTASHIVNDVVKAPATTTGCRPFRAFSLVDCTPLMTAYANDVSYADMFSSQLEALGREEDVLVAISGSGNSPNVLEAARCAQRKKMRVVAMTGYDGGELKNLCELNLHVPCDCMAQVEDAHLILGHALVEALKTALAPAQAE
jgi:D-sedoheptulose 7-phosphate isomerase